MTPYLHFNRSQWAALRDSVPMTLTEGEIARLKGINEDLSLEEVAEIYLPLSRLLNFYISSNLRRQAVLEQFLGTNGQRIPYIISIAGSVAVGKSTTARVLQALLSRWPEHRSVELITTDGFLHPNAELQRVDAGRDAFLAPRVRAVADALAGKRASVEVDLLGTAFQK